MESKNNEKKVLALSFLGVLTFIAVVVGATYAYFTAQGGTSANTNVNVQTATTDNLSFQTGAAINLTANQEDFGSGMGNKSGSTYARAILTANNATNNATRNYYIYLDITSNDFEYTTVDEQAELLLKVTDPTGSEVTTLGSLERKTSGGVTGFDITESTGLITIADNYEIVSTGTETQEWSIEVIFANLDADQNANTGKTFSANLIIQEETMTTSLGNAAEYVANLYTTDGVNGLYYHDADLANGTQDNSYRYSGANPNNYVCFGTDEATCPEDNLYRIIGVFNDQVKLIKSTSYGNYAWDAGNSNTWDASTKPDIYTTLNETYYNTLGSEWQSKIATHSWKVGGMGRDTSATAKDYYDTEVGSSSSSTTDSMKIGLMYVSDYGYGASEEYWNTDLFDYDNDTNRNNNWMYMGVDEWTISRNSGTTDNAFYVYNTGYVNGYNGVYGTLAVRPSFYLESSVVLEGGSGTSADPYRLSVN